MGNMATIIPDSSASSSVSDSDLESVLPSASSSIATQGSFTCSCDAHQLKPASLVESFELLDFYDEHLGHMMWYAPLFAAYLVYFYGSFGKSCSTGFGVWLLAIFGAGFEWYLVTEGQIFTIFILMFACMVPIVAIRAQQGLAMDSNAKFLFFRSALTLVLVVVWVAYLWNDDTLRKKYPGWLYIPEPWAYVSLYWMH
eukprot:Em0007g952a